MIEIARAARCHRIDSRIPVPKPLIEATLAMAADGVPLMRRVLPPGTDQRLWDRYPTVDAVAPGGARYFYHSHPPGERAAGEQGHFHLFLPLTAMRSRRKNRKVEPRCAPPDRSMPGNGAVHVVALSIDDDGLPMRLFTTNRWVTDEWLFDAATVAAALPRFDVSGAPGDPLVNRWLTAAVALAAARVSDLLHERDRFLALHDPSGEDRRVEITSSMAIDIQSLIES